MRQLFGLTIWHRKLIGFCLALPILTILGPFGTYADFRFSERFAFWFLLLCGVGVFMHVMITSALNHPKLKNVGQVGAITIGAALAAFPGAIVVFLVEMFMRPPGMTISVQQLSTLWLQVTLIGVAIGHFEFFTWPFKEAAHVAPAFVDRLPEHVSRKTDVISLSMQDHYVEATTDNGTFVVLMRLSDAMNEFAPDHGIQIHRSHWVARSHMKGKHKTGNRTFLDLSDGRSLPVSLTYLPEVERALSG